MIESIFESVVKFIFMPTMIVLVFIWAALIWGFVAYGALYLFGAA